MFRSVNRWLFRLADRRQNSGLPRKDDRDDREGGAGVRVPAPPRPRRDGAQAKPPEPVKS